MVTLPVSHGYLKFFADFIESELGIVYAEANYFQLERRLQDIATLLGYSGPLELYEKAQPRPTGQARDLVLDVATNNETSFFRDPNTFRALEETIVPTMRKEFPERRSLRFWSAAASTGQEAYSIVMTLEAMRAKDPASPDYSILATDISERVLKRAAAGVYSQLEAQRGLSARHLVQFFEKQGDSSWAVRPELKRKLQFRPLNLLGDWSGVPSQDIVFCRNVLIYQSPANKAKVVQRIFERLVPGGYLVLGGTESLLGIEHKFETRSANGAYFYRKPAEK